MDIDRLRDLAALEIDEGDPEVTITIGMYPEAGECGFLDDEWDEAGDSIQAEADVRFLSNGSPLIRVEFGQGSSPQGVARVLRKIADMMEGPQGRQIANLRPCSDALPHEPTHARRSPDGAVRLFNLRTVLKDGPDDWQSERGDPQDD